MTPRSGSLALVGVLTVAAWLRLGELGRESLWLDELFTVRVASRPSWAEFYAELAQDVHPPLWFAILRFLPDGGDAGWRLPSALVGLLGVGLAVVVARRLAGGGTYGERAGLLAAGLCATAPGLVLLEREARANAALSAGTLALVALALRPPSSRWRWTLGLLAAALVNLHPFGPFVLVGLALYLWIDPGDGVQLSARGGLLVGLAGAAALAPWAMTTLVGQAAHFATSPWYVEPPGDSLGWVLTELVDNQPGFLAIPLLGLALAARQEGAAERRGLMLVVAFATALVLVPQALSYVAVPVLRTRSALPLLPLVLVAAALGLARAGRLGVALGGFACGAQLLASTHATRMELRSEQWREAAAWLDNHATPGDFVLLNQPQLWRIYLPDRFTLRDVAAPEVDAAGGGWLLLGHDLDARGWSPGEAATAGPDSAGNADFVGARVRRLGPYSRPLPLRTTDPATGSAERTHAAMWGAGGVETPSLRARGDCAVAFSAHEDAAGTEPARLRVRLRREDRVLLDETLAVAPEEVLTGRTTALFAEPGAAEVTVRLEFVNDAVIDGHDRNVYVDSVRLDCR